MTLDEVVAEVRQRFSAKDANGKITLTAEEWNAVGPIVVRMRDYLQGLADGPQGIPVAMPAIEALLEGHRR